MYLSEGGDFSEPTVVQSPSESSGLYIRTRGGELTKVSIPEDSLAFQLEKLWKLLPVEITRYATLVCPVLV